MMFQLKSYWLTDVKQPLAPLTNDTQTFLGDSMSRFYNRISQSPI